MADLSIGRFSKKGRQLQDILITLVNDKDFVKLVASSKYDPLNDSDIGDDFDNMGLIGTKIYSQVYEPPVDTAVVNVNVYYKQARITSGNPFYKNSDIVVAIVIHRDLWEMEGGLRAFEIADRVDLLLNRKAVTNSLSKEWFTDMKYYPVSSLYSVVELKYSNWD